MENKPISEIRDTFDYIGSSVEPNEEDSLAHFNPNHDALGRFSSGVGGAVSSVSAKLKSRGGSNKSKSGKSSNIEKGAASKSVKKKSRKEKQGEAKAKKVSELQTAKQRKESAKKVLNSGDAKKIYENRDSFTTQQLNDAINRINTEKILRSIVAEQNPSKMAKLKKVVTPANIKKVAEYTNEGINLYNNVARIANTSLPADKQMKYVGQANNANNKVMDAKLTDIMRSGSAEYILRNQKSFTTDQLTDAKKRAAVLKELNKMAEQERR